MVEPSATGMPRVVAVVGPTATGKSDLGVALARALGGEVVNADSMQLYRGMDIGTAKLALEERSGVVHHLLDVLEITEMATAAGYQDRARPVVDDILARGVVPVVVGGSGLYLRSLLDEFEFPRTDPDVRARLEARLETEGVAALYSELQQRDPDAAAAMNTGNGRRIVRALEVGELTGRPYAASLPGGDPHYDVVQIGLDDDPDALDRRVAARVERMWQRGFVAEVRALVDAGLRQGRTAPRAIGYSHVLRQLDGEFDAGTAREVTASATRRLVRRQRSWFRTDLRINWLPAAAPDLVARALVRIGSQR